VSDDRERTHYVGDDCPPNGHRTDAVPDGMDVGDGEPGGDQPPDGVPGVPKAGDDPRIRKLGDLAAALSSGDPLDDDGYPTDETLTLIRKFGSIGEATPNWALLLAFCTSIWRYPDYVEISEDGRRFVFATGGWSGNESIIEALQGNGFFWILCWFQSERGGRHVFEVRP
jgi:hypothetical protein